MRRWHHTHTAEWTTTYGAVTVAYCQCGARCCTRPTTTLLAGEPTMVVDRWVSAKHLPTRAA